MSKGSKIFPASGKGENAIKKLRSIRSYWTYASLSAKLALVFFLITLVASLTVGFVSYQLSKSIITRSSREKAEVAAQTVASSLNNFFRAADQTAISIYSDAYLHLLLNLPTEELPIPAEYHPSIDQTVLNTKALNESVAYVNLFGVNGFSYIDSQYQSERARDFASCQGQYPELDAGSASALWVPNQQETINNSRRNVICNVRFIRNIFDFRITGVMVTAVNEASLCRQFQTIGSDSFLLDQNGVILSHPDKALLSRTFRQPALLEQLAGGSSLGTVSFQSEGKRLFATYAVIPATGWYIVNIQDYYQMFRNSYSLFNSILLILILELLLSFLVLLWISRTLTSSLRRLFHTMELAKGGDLSVRYPVSGRDEINRIGGYLNEMLNQIDENVRLKQEVALQRKDSELKLLQAQINPHLLYNTLDSVYYHLETGRQDTATEILKALSQFFKLSLSKGEFLIPLSRELELIRSYLRIQYLCREKNIRFVVEGDPALLASPIPKMTLQPVVENSVIHGFEQDWAEGTITLEVREYQPGKLEMILTDDGEGMTGEQVEQLNWTINRLTGPSSFGLWNVNQRIRHLYGGEYCMTVESEFGVYTKTRITIPLDGSPSIREPNA